MSYAIPSHYDEPALDYAAVQPDLIFVPRSKMQWVPFLAPIMLTGLSWLSGGAPELTDMGFLIFTILCIVYLISEFINFPRRFGIGGLVLWGGVLCWFCQDYFTQWFHRDFQNSPMPAVIIAKAAFLHVTFVTLMSVGLSIDKGLWAEKILLIVPDPGDDRFYLSVMLALAAFGISPYFLFNGPDQPWYSCMFHAMFAGWVGPPHFDVYRTGNLNYSWGAYVAQIMQVGEVSGIVSIVYTILIAPTILLRLLGMTIWSFYALVAFETGRRGNIAFTVLPPIALLFIKYQARAAMMFRGFSPKAFLICGLLTVGMQFAIQFQGTFRDSGFEGADLSRLNLLENQGNTMFSEGLVGYALIPDVHPFVYSNDFPGEGFLFAIPKTVVDLVIGIIPARCGTINPLTRSGNGTTPFMPGPVAKEPPSPKDWSVRGTLNTASAGSSKAVS